MIGRTFSLWRDSEGITVPMWCEVVSYSRKSKIVRFRELRPRAPLQRIGFRELERRARW